MAQDEKSGKDPASIAARLIKHPETATKKEIQTLSGSVLTQSPDKPAGKSTKK